MHRPWIRLILFAIVALGTPTSAVRAGPSEDRQCAQLQGTPATTGCFQEADGSWFFPEGPDDPRIIGGPILSPDETDWVDQIAVTIEDQMDGLWEHTGFIRSDVERIGATQTNRNGRLLPGAGWNESGTWWNVYQYYAPEAANYFQSPNNVEIGAYATWWHDRLMAGMPSRTGSEMADTVAQREFDRVPWPWDLADPVNLTSFFRWALDHGYINPLSTEEAMEDASDGDCVAFAYWLASTEGRIDAVDEEVSALGPETDGPILRDTADAIRSVANVQAASDPPASARALNLLLVNAMEDLAAAYEEQADVLEQQLPYEDFVAANEHLGRASEDFRDAADLVNDEGTRCGL